MLEWKFKVNACFFSFSFLFGLRDWRTHTNSQRSQAFSFLFTLNLVFFLLFFKTWIIWTAFYGRQGNQDALLLLFQSFLAQFSYFLRGQFGCCFYEILFSFQTKSWCSVLFIAFVSLIAFKFFFHIFYLFVLRTVSLFFDIWDGVQFGISGRAIGIEFGTWWSPCRFYNFVCGSPLCLHSHRSSSWEE